ncbi:SMP-30/gluconolactonase/LRE family protein [Streptomyces sp. NPDC059740]|uniref:SMP-30/gluconolactonase/LRE family protein n=1 Tax=Streptomyces sp. NPDC059740 TaxID=3346926 RepID=UPI0036675266
MHTDPALRVDAGTVRALSCERLELGEGIRLLADGQVVLVDILAGRLLRLDPGASPEQELTELARLEEPLGAVAPVGPAGSGRWLAAAGTGFALLDTGPGADPRPRWVARPLPATGPGRRMNDAVCDPAGRMWAGSMAYDGTAGAGSLYRIGPDGTVTEVLGDLTVPNGPAFSPDGRTLYLADSARGHIDAFTVDPRHGTLHDRRPFARVDPAQGSPDGMVTDSAGRLWCALWGGAQVRCHAPDGTLLASVPLPARQPTSICLTGRRMLVTTAFFGLTDPGPLDGAVLELACRVSAPPTPAAAWVG